MSKTWLVVFSLGSAVGLGGCWNDGGYYGGGGGGQLRSFEADDCSVVSSATVGGQSAGVTSCRLRYDDQAQVYSWQFMNGSTGQWTSQGQGWFTLSFNVNSPQNAALPLSTNDVEEPGWVGLDEVVLAYAPTSGTHITGTGSVILGSNIIYAGGDGSSLDARLDVTLSNGQALGGEVSASIGGTPTLTNDASVQAVRCDEDAGTCPDGG